MSKSVYSLILNDDVIDQIDRLARINGLSRSNMVEKILADNVGYETPEIRANNVFDEIERIIRNSSGMRFLDQPSQYMASIMSAIDYRYNPAIKYNVELFPQSDYLGQLKVSLRTQNEILLNLIKDFYNYYIYIEQNNYNPEARFLTDGQKFIRLFNFPKVRVTSKELAEKITVYVMDFDKLLNIYFNHLTSSEDRLMEILEENYKELKKDEIVF